MKFIKNNWLFLLFLFLGFFLSIKVYTESKNFTESEKKIIQEIKESCIEKEKKGQLKGESLEFCLPYIKNSVSLTRNEFYLKFDNIAISNNLLPISFLAPLIMIVVSLYRLNYLFKSRNCLLLLKRESYPKFLRNYFKKAYTYVFLLVIISLMVILSCLIHSKIDPSQIALNGSLWDLNLMNKPWLFLFLYLLNILFHSGFYINLGLITYRYQHNYFIAVLEAFLLVIAIQLFLEIGIGGILFGKILKDYGASLIFNILNLFVFNIAESRLGVIGILLFSFSCFLISSFVVYLCYHSKEKLVIDCEKNN